MKLFVMSDVHSYFEEMAEALHKNGFEMDNEDHNIVICGDLFDRGPDAVKLFEFVKEMAKKDRLFYVWGNHEDLLFDCVEEIIRGRGISSHHISNGTFDTVCQLTAMSKYDLAFGPLDREQFNKRIEPVLEFIRENAVDLVEAGDYVFVHGWVPCDPIEGRIAKNWDTPDADWDEARWINGMQAWHRGARLPGKTIVCGHWHTSWGWANLVDNERYEEFPGRKSNDLRENFAPFIQDGIIAIDACTAYTGFCNCLVLDV